MKTFACVFFKPNDVVPDYSRCYNESWVEKLYRGVQRHTPPPWNFICLVDRIYEFKEPIQQIRLEDPHSDWQSLMELFRLEGTVLGMGLDTLITGDLSEIMTYTGPLALTKGQDHDSLGSPQVPANGVMLFNNGPEIYRRFRDDPERRKAYLGAYVSELAWLRLHYSGKNQPDYVEDLFPGQVLHYNWHIAKGNYDEKKARVVYFAGRTKPHTMLDVARPSCPEFLKNVWI